MNDRAALFGRALGRALGNGPPQASLGVQRANLLAAAHRMGRRRSQPRWELGLALAAAGLIAVLAAFVAQRELSRPDVLSARWNGREVVENAELTVSAGAAKPLEFSDGSKLVFAPSSRAKLARLAPQRATLRLDRGRFEADIRHQPGMTWGIAAGPYLVEVIGTRFSVDWATDASNFLVQVRDGTVRVTGGDLGPNGVTLRRGERFERRSKTPEEEPEAEAPEPEATEKAPPEPAPPRIQQPPSAPEPSVAALASAGKYRQALELAERQGFEKVIGELGENDLLLLANAARYSGASARARQALLKLRQRFPGRPASDLAALYLARVAEQAENRPDEAVRWLRTFLQESPTGDLAQSARGSLLSILSGRGDTAGARAVAKDYLRYHPEGPLSEQARSLVSRTKPP